MTDIVQQQPGFLPAGNGSVEISGQAESPGRMAVPIAEAATPHDNLPAPTLVLATEPVAPTPPSAPSERNDGDPAPAMGAAETAVMPGIYGLST